MKKNELLRLLNPVFFAVHLLRNSRLIGQFAVREFQIKYKKTFLGLVWSVIVPLVMLLVYTFVFSVVFNARWGTTHADSRVMFAVILFANLTIYNVFSEIVGSSPNLILANSNLVKKVIFPLEILPVTRVISCFFNSIFNLLILLAALFFVEKLDLHALYAPLIYFPVLLFALGGSYFVSSLTVFIRDIGQVIGILLTLLLFLSPIFYPLSAVPEQFRKIIQINPLATTLDQFRLVMVEGQAPDFQIVLLLWVGGILFSTLGFAWFMKIKNSFADVM